MNILSAVGAFDIVAIVLISAAVLGVIGRIIYKKVTHKGGGCCDCCDGCCAHCRTKENKS